MAREGKRQYEDGLLNSAERVLEKAVQIDPTNQKAWYYLHCVKESLYGPEKEQQYWHDRMKRREAAEEVTRLPAEPRASPDGGPKGSTACSGASEGPPSVG